MGSTRKIVLYICHSLDGYIAEEDGGVSWAEKVDSGGSDCGYTDFLNSIDTAIIGKTTYEQMIGWDDPLFKNKQCFVFSSSPNQSVKDVQFVNQEASSFVHELKQREGANIWLLGGGKLVSTFLNEGLIDEMILSIIPMTLGKGIPLFRRDINRSDWVLKNIIQYGSIARVHYTLNKK